MVDLDWRTPATFAALFAGLVLVAGVARSMPRTLTSIALATLFTLALNPLVQAVQRRLSVRRSVAVAVVLTLLVAALTAALLLLVPPAVRQARDLGDELPTVAKDLGNLPGIGPTLRHNDVPAKLEEAIRSFPKKLSGDTTPLERVGSSVFDGLVAAGITLLLAFTLLVDGERILRGLRRIVPARQRGQADRFAALAYEVVGHYVAGSLLVAAVAGITVLVVGTILGVPLTPLAALWVSLWDLVPQIGGAAGGIPFVLLGFTHSAGTGLACAVFFVVYLQLENHVLQPLLVGQAVKLSPPATMTAALIGVSVGGLVGGLFAVPLVGAAKAVYLETRKRPAAVTEP